MPPPMKNAITNEHEELLWNNKLLSTDTSIGLIQAVIFYLIKGFGLWQGRDLKLLKTEHVTFSEDEIGKFVAIDIRKALGSGRVIKRYDDQGNPRSVYKIMKTYKGYLANEGPFLVRPISSIKDYICYSPWPVGLTILEQTVVNIMQDCGVGPGFGNVSVCLMSIDILKSFGTGGHCISTWFSRLYPKYKKTFWAEAFRECSDMNCEDKNQEACLMISHLLDPPYPATKMLSEMKKHQEMMTHRVNAIDAQRSSMFTSWISNLNSIESAEAADTTETGLQKSKANKKRKMSTRSTATEKEKPHGRVKQMKRNLRQNVSACDTSTKPPQLATVLPSTSSSLPASSNITVKTEVLTDCESSEVNVNSSNMKIMAVLSIPESAFSAQVDEAECTVVGIVEGVTPTDQTSEGREGDSSVDDNHSKTSSSFMQKLSDSKDDDIDSSLGAKQTKVYKQEVDESEAEKNGSLTNDSQTEQAADIESNTDIVSPKVKEELESEDESCIDKVSSDSYGNTEYDGKKEVYSENRESYIGEHRDVDKIITRAELDICPGDLGVHVCPCSPDVEKPNFDKDNFLSAGLDSELPVEHDLETPSALTAKDSQLMAELLHPPLPNSSLSTSVLLPVSVTTLSNNSKDSIKILRKLLQQEGKTDAASADTGSKTPAVLGSRTSHGEISMDSTSCNSLWEATCADTCSSLIQEAETTGQEVNHTTHSGRIGSKYYSTNKSNVSNSHTNLNQVASSAESKGTLSVNEILHLSTVENPASLSHSQTGTDIARFLDVANQQLENILQVSSASASQGSDISQHSSTAGIHSHHLSEEQPSGLSSHPRTLTINNSSESLLNFLQSKPSCESSVSTDSLPSCFNSKLCHSFNTVSAVSVSEVPNVNISNNNAPSPLLGSVLEEPTSSGTEAGQSLVNAHLHSRPFRKRSVLKKKPARLKVPLLKQAQKMTTFCCRCRHKPYHRPKSNRPFRTTSPHKQTYTNDQLSSSHTPGETNSTNNYNTSTRSHLHPVDSGMFPNPSLSLLTKARVDSSSNSGFYHFRSDRRKNAAYQTVRVNKENKGSQTFTISDLPLDVPESGRQDVLQQGSPTSEICLGDYFPAGTLLPVKDVKLLTRQSSNSLEVVLKFEYRVSKHETQTVEQLDKDKLKDSKE